MIHGKKNLAWLLLSLVYRSMHNPHCSPVLAEEPVTVKTGFMNDRVAVYQGHISNLEQTMGRL